MNKRIALLIISLYLLNGGVNLFAQSIDKPAATVKLDRFEVITVKQLNGKIEAIEKRTKQKLSTADRWKFLDLLISEILIDQAASQENVTVTESEVNARIELAKQSGGLSMNLNRKLTDVEFQSIVSQSGLTWDEYLKQLKKAIIQQKYVMQRKRSFLENIPPPTEMEIIEFYEANKTAFVAPDMVRFKHIFIDTRNLQSKDARDKAREKAEGINRELQNGAAFEDMVIKYTEDNASRYRGGDFGYLRRDDAARKQLLGKDFFELTFRKEVGEISGVHQSNIGFHIIKIEEKIPFQLLTIDDKIPPRQSHTVKDEIRSQLIQRKQAEYYQKSLLDILAELKKKAEIKIFENNLSY